MVNAMNAAIAAKAAAIAVPIVDPHAFDAPTQRALDAGIPVFAYNADAPAGSANKRLAYIGQDLYQSGYKMGERIASMVDSGLVALFIATPGQLNIQPRLDGAVAAIKKSGKKIETQQIATGATVNEELSKIKAFYLGHQDLKGMFAVDAGSTQGVGEVMQQYKLAAKGVHAGGYDLLPRTLELIQSGDLDFTIDQQAYLQGFYTAMEMFLYARLGRPERPGRHQHRPEIRHQGQRRPVPLVQDPLRRQLRQAPDRPARRLNAPTRAKARARALSLRERVG